MKHSTHWMNRGILAAALAMIAGCEGPMDEAGPEEAESPLLVFGRPFYDIETTCTVGGVTMHCCPPGTAMVGVHVIDNVLKCELIVLTQGQPFADFGTQRNDMHACPYGSIMVGLHVERNVLACQYSGEPVLTERVDVVSVDRYPMHVCTSSVMAMSGIHVDRNLFTCAG